MTANLMMQLLKDKRGATAIEYGLIAGLIAVAIVGALNNFASETSSMYNKISTAVTSATAS